MDPSILPAPIDKPKVLKPRLGRPPKVHAVTPLSAPKPIYISFISLQSLISTYKSQYLNFTTDQFTPDQLLDLTDHWDLLISDCFHEVYEKTLKCTSCPEIHYDKAIKDSLENLRTAMERTPVLDISEENIEVWEDDIAGFVATYWKDLKADGGCPATRPKPGTLVDGKLVLDEWEKRVRNEWMERMFGFGWREHPVVTGKPVEEILNTEVVDVGIQKVVMKTVHDPIVGNVAPKDVRPGQAYDEMGGMVSDVNFDEEEEEEVEEEGIAARLLRDMGMQDYEYKGKEIDYGKPGPGEFVRETGEA